MSEPVEYDLQRFVDAQEPSFQRALEEIQCGRKCTHWIWYVFPQMRKLGSSSNSQHYGVSSLDEARAYLAHPILGPRLIAAARAMLDQLPRSPRDVLGSPDDIKFHSSITPFARATNEETVFRDALEAFFNGVEDARTLRLIDSIRSPRWG